MKCSYPGGMFLEPLGIVFLIGCVAALLFVLRLYHLDTTPLKLPEHRVVFLDIGGHKGQTTAEAIKSNLFDQIYTFEPVPQLASRIKNLAEKMNNQRSQVQVIQAAIGQDDGEATLYMPGTHSGTIYANRWKNEPESIRVPKLDAGTWFRENLKLDDVVFVKINCEGGEVGIIDSLVASDELKKIENVMIDFDIKRLFGRDDERLRLISILESYEVSFIDPRYIEKWGLGTGYLSVLRAITYLRIIRQSLRRRKKAE